MGIISTLDNLKFLKNSGTVALCHGVFDVLHEGHLNYLEEAKKLCSTLVVSVTEDRFVNKGPGRPHFNQNVRARMLAALEAVDFVVINNEPKAVNVIKALQPKFYVKGSEYKIRNDITKGIEEEEEAIKSVGGEMVYTDLPTRSSSELINKFFNSFTEEQNEVILKVKSLGGIDKIHEIFKQISNLDVTVVGEPIIDTYIFCRPEGISSKSPTISARHIYEENYAGGSLAIANHIADFVRNVQLFAPFGREALFQKMKKEQVDRRVIYYDNMYANYTTPRKTRFIDPDKSQRMFEITNINEPIWMNYDPKTLIDVVSGSAKETGTTLICDFGHGLFENGFLKACYNLEGFIAVNCQTNSSNFGFNPYTKHNNYHYLSIDLKEARVAFHDRYSDLNSLFKKLEGPAVSMTLGPGGAMYRYFKDETKCPSFCDKVVDAIGAGDAYYGITALLRKVNAPIEIVPFIGNVFAGLKANTIGNKYPVTRAQLFKTLNALLK